MTAASSPQPVCMDCGRWPEYPDGHHPSCASRPAAPSEPPAEAVAPWPYGDAVQPDIEDDEPPAEAQQDDEQKVADRLWRLYTHWSPQWKMPTTVNGFRKDARYILAALAAQPSADTETLRRAIAAAEQRGYERAQNECPPGGWESGLVTVVDRPDNGQDEPCVCDTGFTCLADEHDKGRCDACETPGIYPLCCADHQAHMCPACVVRCHEQQPARWVTLPGDQQHTSGGNCPCQPVQADNGAWDHQ